ncbi:MAG: hypothetical protein R2751_01235 [Bacteroidales bacterium]
MKIQRLLSLPPAMTAHVRSLEMTSRDNGETWFFASDPPESASDRGRDRPPSSHGVAGLPG